MSNSKKSMKVKVIQQQGNNLQVKFDISHINCDKFLTLTSPEYLCGAINFQLQAYSARCVADDRYTSPDYNTIISIRFTKLFQDDNLKYTCKFSSPELGNVNQKFTETNTWHQIFNHKQAEAANGELTFVASFRSDLASTEGSFASIYDDDESTDFKFCGEDGSVKVHKLVLKVSSPVLQEMLNGEWKETSEGKFTVADVSKETCKYFKDYIYLNKLPTTGIEQLLVLGSYLMMPNLVQKCLVKLLNKLDADNIVEMMEFTCNFKVTNLFVTLMNIVRDGLVNIDHLSEDPMLDVFRATNASLNRVSTPLSQHLKAIESNSTKST